MRKADWLLLLLGVDHFVEFDNCSTVDISSNLA